MKEFEMNREKARELSRELTERVFKDIAEYLGVEVVPAIKERLVDSPEVSPEIKSFISPITTSTNFFSVEDEEEIQHLTKSMGVGSADLAGVSVEEIEGKIDEIVRRADINFGSSDLLDRFRQILKIYLKSVRSRVDTKEALLRPIEMGGLAFDRTSADEIVALADQAKASPPRPAVNPPRKITVPEDALSGAAEYDLAKELAKKKEAAVVEAPNVWSELRAEEGADKIKKIENSEQKELIENKPEEVAEEASPAKPEVSRKIIKSEAPGAGKVRMDDVKVPQVLGPIDELRHMDLNNFRRLDKNPGYAIHKIMEKINVIEDDGFDKRMEAVKAWRQSPVYKLYLELGEESMEQKKPVEIIIAERKDREERYLSNEEFSVIMDLNKSLRF